MLNKYLYLKKECTVCEGRGHIFDDKREFRGEVETNTAKQCECVKKMARYFQYEQANIPREYWDLSMDSFREISEEKVVVKEKIQEIISNIDSYIRQGRSLLLYGNKGTGKTMLSIEILKGALRHKYSAHYDFYPVMFSEFQKKGYKADEVKARYEEMLVNKDFLVLDELLKERDYFSGSGDFNESISKRFLEMNVLKKRSSKPTIIISNIQNGLEDIKEHYGPYVHSVMSHNFDLIRFKDDDFREMK